jgi:hypothetical protein
VKKQDRRIAAVVLDTNDPASGQYFIKERKKSGVALPVI